MAATRPRAVASSASAMPGATTARLVVCDSEMPMKLFMMPQTVPKRPTKGAVAPMVARMPVPMASRRPAPASMRERCEETRGSRPARASARGGAGLVAGGADHERGRAAACRRARCSAVSRSRAPRMTRQAAAEPGAGGEDLEALGEADRPGDERGEGEADHHRLHHDVGRHEHAPGREVVGQRGRELACGGRGWQRPSRRTRAAGAAGGAGNSSGGGASSGVRRLLRAGAPPPG